jgi:hypothetical protein
MAKEDPVRGARAADMRTDPFGIFRYHHPIAVMGEILDGPRYPRFAPVDALPDLGGEPRVGRFLRPPRLRTRPWRAARASS